MARKKRILRRPGKAAQATAVTTIVRSVIGSDDVHCAVRLQLRANGEFCGKTTVDEAVAEAMRLWKLHSKTAIEYRAEHFPGTRPELFWREHRGKDLAYLRKQKLMLPGEEEHIAEHRKKRGGN